MEVYPLVLPQKLKIFLEGLRVLCIRWWERKAIHGMFKWIWDKYGGFDGTREVANLGGGWTTVRIRESRKVGKGKSTKL